MTTQMPTGGTSHKTSCIMVALAWTVVGIPAGWGIYQTVLTSIKLFQAPAQPPPAIVSPSAPAPK